MKNFFTVLFLILVFTSPAYADIVWPALYITKGMLSIPVILGGLLVELIFVKFFARVNWKQASTITFLMNLISCLLGTFLIPLTGLLSELVFDFIFHLYDKFGIGTFHWSHWLISYMLVIILNTTIEGTFIKISLKLKFGQTFSWLLLANSLSVFFCFLVLLH